MPNFEISFWTTNKGPIKKYRRSSKKEGQQNAAKMALILYGYLKDDQFENSDIFYPDWDKIDSANGEEILLKNELSLEELEVESEDEKSIESQLSEKSI